MNERLLRDGLVELGLDAPEVFEGLAAYVALIERDNPALGLVGAQGDELVVKHILDSLTPIAIFDRVAAEGGLSAPDVADLGTGAGLPGVPLAIARPGWNFTLIDRMTRRTDFLEDVRVSLGLDNVTIVEEQVERAKSLHDIVTFRAFRPFERKLFKRILALCKPDGRILAYKGKADRAREELPALAEFPLESAIIPVKVPFLDDERCVVELRAKR